MAQARFRFNSRRAFSLLEGLITLFLVALVFGLIADLLFDAYRAMRFAEHKNQANQAAQMALNRICSEVRECALVEGTGTEVKLLKIDPTVPRFQPDSPGAPPNDRYAALLRVRYFVDGTGLLLREVGPLSGAAEVQTVVDGVVGLNCTVSGTTANFQISLSVRDPAGVVRPIYSEVFPMGMAP